MSSVFVLQESLSFEFTIRSGQAQIKKVEKLCIHCISGQLKTKALICLHGSHADLCLCFSNIQKPGFLVMQLNRNSNRYPQHNMILLRNFEISLFII